MNVLLKKLFFLNRSKKILIFVIIDLFLSSISLWASFSIRLEKLYNPLEIEPIFYFLFFLTFSTIQYFSKSYLKFSRNFDISSINLLIRNFFFLFIFIFLFKINLFKNHFLPGSVVLIYSSTFFFLTLFKNSLIYNLFYYIKEKLDHDNTRILLYGFNNQTLKYIENFKRTPSTIKGIYEKKILNTSLGFKTDIVNKYELISYIKKKNITDIIISKNNNYENKIKYYKKFLNFNCRILFLDEIYAGSNKKLRNNFFQPKIDHILDFDKTEKEKKKIKSLFNKTVLILGGAGSIGSQLVDSCLENEPKKIIILDKDEFEIFNLKKKYNNNKKIIIRLLDLKYKDFLEKIYKLFKPEVVFNAAAYKHVNIVESNFNFAMYNNIKIALNVCELSKKYNVKVNLLISTDKAVKPKNFMGKSKNICEKIYLSFSKRQNKNKNLIVRFGNVAGSRGSVLPLFQQLINLRQALTVTHKKATRYLMSIKEACDLILKVSEIGVDSKIYILDMGSPKNIYNLAKIMIKMNGLTIKSKGSYKGDIPINIIGLKKGEKLHEKLSYKINFLKTRYDKILLCDEKFDNNSLLHEVRNLLKNKRNWSDKKIKSTVTKLAKK